MASETNWDAGNLDADTDRLSEQLRQIDLGNAAGGWSSDGHAELPIDSNEADLIAAAFGRVGMPLDPVEAMMRAFEGRSVDTFRAVLVQMVTLLQRVPKNQTIGIPDRAKAKELMEKYDSSDCIGALEIKSPAALTFMVPQYVPIAFIAKMHPDIIEAKPREKDGIFIGADITLHTSAGAQDVFVPDPELVTNANIQPLLAMMNARFKMHVTTCPIWVTEVAALVQNCAPRQLFVEGQFKKLRQADVATVSKAKNSLPPWATVLQNGMIVPRREILELAAMFAKQAKFESVLIPANQATNPPLTEWMVMAYAIVKNCDLPAGERFFTPRREALMARWLAEGSIYAKSAALKCVIKGELAKLWPGPNGLVKGELEPFTPLATLKYLAEARALRTMAGRDAAATQLTLQGVLGDKQYSQWATVGAVLSAAGWDGKTFLDVHSPPETLIPPLWRKGGGENGNLRIFAATPQTKQGVAMRGMPLEAGRLDDLRGTVLFDYSDPTSGANTSPDRVTTMSGFAKNVGGYTIVAQALAANKKVTAVAFGAYLPPDNFGPTAGLAGNPVFRPLFENFDIKILHCDHLHSDRIFLCGRRLAAPRPVTSELEFYYRTSMLAVGAEIVAANEFIRGALTLGIIHPSQVANHPFAQYRRTVAQANMAKAAKVGLSMLLGTPAIRSTKPGAVAETVTDWGSFSSDVPIERSGSSDTPSSSPNPALEEAIRAAKAHMTPETLKRMMELHQEQKAKEAAAAPPPPPPKQASPKRHRAVMVDVAFETSSTPATPAPPTTPAVEMAAASSAATPPADPLAPQKHQFANALAALSHEAMGQARLTVLEALVSEARTKLGELATAGVNPRWFSYAEKQLQTYATIVTNQKELD